MSRILVTGAASFTARHLLPLLARDPGATLHATDRVAEGPPGTRCVPLDLLERDAVAAEVGRIRPEIVFHLAGVTSPDPQACFDTNLGATRNLLEACAALPSPPRVLVVSSAAVYGLTTPEESLVRESTPLRPITPYGASKAAAEIMALSMHRRGLLRVKVARPFNLVGPGLRPGFAPSDFLRQALAIRDGDAAPEIRVGNLEPRRDFVDVRDAALAYRALIQAESGWGEAYNVATGRPVAVRDLLALILEVSGVTARTIEDPARRRTVEVVEQVGDAGALRALTGWRPGVPLETSLRDMAA